MTNFSQKVMKWILIFLLLIQSFGNFSLTAIAQDSWISDSGIVTTIVTDIIDSWTQVEEWTSTWESKMFDIIMFATWEIEQTNNPLTETWVIVTQEEDKPIVAEPVKNLEQTEQYELFPNTVDSYSYTATKNTYCSYMTRLNLERITWLPSSEEWVFSNWVINIGDANILISKGWKNWSLIPFNNNKKNQIIDYFQSQKNTIFDVYSYHNTMSGTDLEKSHRFMVFKWNDKELYVLDFVATQQTSPQLLSDYLSSDPYHSDFYVSSISYNPASTIKTSWWSKEEVIKVSHSSELVTHALLWEITAEFDSFQQPTKAHFLKAFQRTDKELTAYIPKWLVISVDGWLPFNLASLWIWSGETNTGLTESVRFGIPGQHLIFSKPVKLEIPVWGIKDWQMVSVVIKHEWDTRFGTEWLTTNPDASCNESGISSDESHRAQVNNWIVTIYTCGASTIGISYGGTCGDGVVDIDEICDDGNEISGDWCKWSTGPTDYGCELESGYICSLVPANGPCNSWWPESITGLYCDFNGLKYCWGGNNAGVECTISSDCDSNECSTIQESIDNHGSINTCDNGMKCNTTAECLANGTDNCHVPVACLTPPPGTWSWGGSWVCIESWWALALASVDEYWIYSQTYATYPSISYDGRYTVVITQWWMYGWWWSDLWLYDRLAWTWRFIDGADNERPYISADGSRIAYIKWWELLIYNTTTNSVEVVLWSSKYNPSLSYDGNLVAYNHWWDVELYRISDWATLGISVWTLPNISSNGEYISYENGAWNIELRSTAWFTVWSILYSAAGKESSVSDYWDVIYNSNSSELIYYNHNGTTIIVDSGSSYMPDISANGQFVSFSTLNQLLSTDINVIRDVYIANIRSGSLQHASLLSGIQSDSQIGDKSTTVISDDGNMVAMHGHGMNRFNNTGQEAQVFLLWNEFICWSGGYSTWWSTWLLSCDYTVWSVWSKRPLIEITANGAHYDMVTELWTAIDYPNRSLFESRFSSHFPWATVSATFNPDGIETITITWSTYHFEHIIAPDLGAWNIGFDQSNCVVITWWAYCGNGSIDSSYALLDTWYNIWAWIIWWHVKRLAIQPDDKIIVWWSFTEFNSVSRNRIARINTDWSADTSFDPGNWFNSDVNWVAIQQNWKIVVWWSFTEFNGQPISQLAQLNSDGTLDTSFDPGTSFDNVIRNITLDPSGKILVWWAFGKYNGNSIEKIARINIDGTLDTSFNPWMGPNNEVYSIAVQSDGKILIWWIFTEVNGATRNSIARLNSDGSLDTSFDTAATINGNVESIAIQPDGKILIGWGFTDFNGSPTSSIIRLNTDGSMDTSFNIWTNLSVSTYAILIQTDGKIVIGWDFSNYNWTPRQSIVRINADGSLDTSFDPGAWFDGYLQALAIQQDGKIIAWWRFPTYDGVAYNDIARIWWFEQCDDGNNLNGDGCSAVCTIEFVWCGDGVISNYEQCDDGNTSNNDGCNQYCILEWWMSCGIGEISLWVGNLFYSSYSGWTLYAGTDSLIQIITTSTNSISWTIAMSNGQIGEQIQIWNYLYIGHAEWIDVLDMTTNQVISIISTPWSNNDHLLLTWTKLIGYGANGYVNFIDLNSNTLTNSLSVWWDIRWVTLVWGKIYVNNIATSDISIIDVSTETLIWTITVPWNSSYSTLIGNNLYISSYNWYIYKIDTATDTLVNTIGNGSSKLFHQTLVWDYLYVAAQNDTIWIVNTSNDNITYTNQWWWEKPMNMAWTKLYSYPNNGTIVALDTSTNTILNSMGVPQWVPESATLVENKLYLNFNGWAIGIFDTLTDNFIQVCVCGDGMTWSTEQCDDGNVNPGDGCSDICLIEPLVTCGDGILTGAEICDDSNLVNGDGCSAVCSIETGYSCSGSPSSCSAVCGDGILTGAEICDDSNLASGDGCSAVCSIETGYSCSGSPSSCAAVCGDGILTGAEVCDDSNLVNGDGCSAVCSIETGYSCSGSPSSCAAVCGDGILTGAEVCDDSNLVNGDGCSAVCSIESGARCTIDILPAIWVCDTSWTWSVQVIDEDHDGVASLIEQSWPNNGDGNNDGISDYLQNSVTTKRNEVTNEYVTMVASGWCQIINGYTFVTEWSLATQDPRDFNLWLHEFHLACGATWGSAEVSFIRDKVYDTSSRIYKKYYSPDLLYANIDSIVQYKTITVWWIPKTVSYYTVIDGWFWDLDGVANWSIRDPAGPSFEVVSTWWWNAYTSIPLWNTKNDTKTIEVIKNTLKRIMKKLRINTQNSKEWEILDTIYSTIVPFELPKTWAY